MTRRELIKWGGLAVAANILFPFEAQAQEPSKEPFIKINSWTDIASRLGNGATVWYLWLRPCWQALQEGLNAPDYVPKKDKYVTIDGKPVIGSDGRLITRKAYDEREGWETDADAGEAQIRKTLPLRIILTLGLFILFDNLDKINMSQQVIIPNPK